MNRPKALKKGDRVGVAAPAGIVSPDALQKGVNAIERMGFRVTLGQHVLSRHRFMAGTDRQRADDLMAMFADPEIKAIVCARGGYGVNRVLPLLKPKIIRANPKIVVGSSDITLLLIYLNRNCSLVAFHGPMAAGSFGRQAMPRSRKQFRQVLTGSADAGRFRSARGRVLRPGQARGTLAGGNLTLMCRSLKTPYEIRTAGAILLIEDVNEKPYRIDGMLWQLRRAGKFKDVRGIVFGEMIHCQPAKHDAYDLDDVIADCFKDDPFPILANCPIAHGKEMWTLPLGVEAGLDTPSKSLTLHDCGVV